MTADDRFVEDCRFAKIVSTADGPAILIAGEVIGIRSEAPHFHVEGITRALRQCHRGAAGSAGSTD